MTALDPKHPLADEIVAAASEPGRPRLAELLDRAGLPGLIQNPEIEPVTPEGQVVIAGRLCDYTVLGNMTAGLGNNGSSDVMMIAGAFPEAFCRDLIEAAERAGAWAQGTQVAGAGAVYTSGNRTSRNAQVNASTGLGHFERCLSNVLREAARFYACWAPHVAANRDQGWEIMRYREGERFGLHVDSIAGSPAWGQRQLSALVYLDPSYEGGETLFPRQGLRLKPAKPGSIALFPPFWTHPHEANAVTGGTKYVTVGWFYP